MWAAAEGHAEAIEVLVEAGAEVNARSSAGWTALLFAAREGQIAGGPDAARAAARTSNDTLLARPGRGRGAGAPERAPVAAQRPPSRGSERARARRRQRATSSWPRRCSSGADPNAAAQGWTALHHLTWIRKPGTGSNDPAPYGSGNMDSLTLVRKLEGAWRGSERASDAPTERRRHRAQLRRRARRSSWRPAAATPS